MNKAKLYTIDHISRFCERFEICGLRRLAKLCSKGMPEGQKRAQGVKNWGESFDFKLKDAMAEHGSARHSSRSTFELTMRSIFSTQKA